MLFGRGLRIVGGACALAAAITVGLFNLRGLLLIFLAASFIVGGLLANPGCEITALPNLFCQWRSGSTAFDLSSRSWRGRSSGGGRLGSSGEDNRITRSAPIRSGNRITKSAPIRSWEPDHRAAPDPQWNRITQVGADPWVGTGSPGRAPDPQWNRDSPRPARGLICGGTCSPARS